MAGNGKSFEELVNDAPPAQAAGTVSLVGMLAKSSEPGKFVLTLRDGSELTLETAAVKEHEVLGASVGQTIVRVDVEAADIPATSPTRVPDMFKAPNDLGGTHQGMDRALPFALATAHQAALSTVAALEAAWSPWGSTWAPWGSSTGALQDDPAPTPPTLPPRWPTPPPRWPTPPPTWNTILELYPPNQYPDPGRHGHEQDPWGHRLP